MNVQRIARCTHSIPPVHWGTGRTAGPKALRFKCNKKIRLLLKSLKKWTSQDILHGCYFTQTQKLKLSLCVASREVLKVSIMAARCLCLTIINVCCDEATYLIGLQKRHLYVCLCAVVFKRSLQLEACICSIVSARAQALSVVKV